MDRFVYSQLHAWQGAVKALTSHSYQVLTPSRLAARALEVSHLSLKKQAVDCLRSKGWALASPLKSQSVFRQVLKDVAAPRDLLGTARAWLPTARLLLQSSSCLTNAPKSVSLRSQTIWQVTKTYQAALHEQSMVDNSELYWRAAELQPKQRQVLIYGYFQPRIDELAWVDAIAASDSIFYLPYAENFLFSEVKAALDWLAHKGWQIVSDTAQPQTSGEQLSRLFIDEVPSPPTMPAYGYGTFDAEVRGTLAQVKQALHEGLPARNIAIVARDEKAYGPKLIDVAWEYDIPLRALYDTPLLTTRLGAWLSLLLDVIETDFPFEATAKLLSHPLCSNPDAGFWAVVRSQHPKGFGQWQNITEAKLGLDLGLLARVNQTRRRDTWVEWWWTLFRTFDLRQRCARWARESIAFNRLADALVELSKPEEELLTWSDFKQQFRELLEVLAVPAQPGRGGVELHSPASVVGSRYARIFLIGMAEGVLPAPVQNDPILDFFERRQLQTQGLMVADAATLVCREGLSFYHLLQAVTETMTFSYAKLRDRQEQLASSYLEKLGLRPSAPPRLPVASLEGLRRIHLRHGPLSEDPVLAKAIFAHGVEQYRESSGPPDEYDGVVGIPFDYTQWRFSASQLTQLGQCPFKWFASRLLKLGMADEAEEDLSPSLRGSLYHKVLELLMQALQTDNSLSLQDKNLLEEKFLEAEQVLELPELPVWSSCREEHIQRLWQVIQQPDFLPDGAEPVALEQKFDGEWQGLQVTGRVDRIDRTPGGLVLIDYKTSGSLPKGVKDTKGKASIDIQLPLYQNVAAASLFPEGAVAETYYYSLTKGKKMTPSSKAPQHELPTVIEQCKDYLNQGHYPVQPDIARTACQYCDFDWVCRQGNRLSHKENCHESD